MYPISDLSTQCRKTTGDVPPKLVGASTTVFGSKMYLYGGRLITGRSMVTDIYVFDLETLNWEKVPQGPEHDVPRARYFHSADVWNNHLVIFGGMALVDDSSNSEDLCVLNDVRFFNLSARRWLPASSDPSADPAAPQARYAHLSCIVSNRLFIIGGQDLTNVWLDDIYLFDLRKQAWTHRRNYPRHCGTYRSVIASPDLVVRFPQQEVRAGAFASKLGSPGSRYSKTPSSTKDYTSSESLVHLPYSAAPTDEHPSDIYLFSNYNFTNVRRELETLKPTPNGDFTITDQSAAMTGASFPPGLRFPTGAVLGTHFIVSGTHLTQSYQAFSIWALDLITLTWSRIDPGNKLSTGAWFRTCLWSEANKYFVFGDSNASLATDYNRRLLSWDNVACIDLEVFGIYQHPPSYMTIENQELGLAALEEGVLSDFDIVCDDGRKISCSRKILEERWPWFKQQRGHFLKLASRAMDVLPKSSHDVPLPEITNISKEPGPDPRLTPRSFLLSESYPVTLAFLQYLYSQALITHLQHAPAVLSQLLMLSCTYNVPHLQSLVKHAMHRALTYATSVGIYGVSTLCNCRSLQIRALRVVMAYSQKRPSARRPSGDRDANGGSSRQDGPGGTAGGGAGGSSDTTGNARPRGMSDTSFIHKVTGEAYAGGANTRGYISDTSYDSTLLSDFPFGTLPIQNDGMLLNELSTSFNTNLMIPSSGTLSPVSPRSTLLKQSSSEGIKASYINRKTSHSTLSSTQSLFSNDPSLRSSPSLSTISSKMSSPTTPESASSYRQLADRNQQMPQTWQISRNPDYLHHRSFSVVSNNTDQDLNAIADLMSPMIAEFTSPSHGRNGHRMVIDEEVGNEFDSSFSWGGQSSMPSPGMISSYLYDDSETADPITDDLCERAYLSPTSASYPAFHLPARFPATSYRDSDTPSLASSLSSYSSSMPRSRAPSIQNFHSPPITPAVSDFGNGGLAMIEEDSAPRSPSRSPGQKMSAIPEQHDYRQVNLRALDTRLRPPPNPTIKDQGVSPLYSSSRQPKAYSPPPTPKTNGSSFVRLLSGGSKSTQSLVTSSENVHSPSVSIKESSSKKGSSKPSKEQKEEEKRRKKEERKSKREQLAAEMQAKRVKAKADKDKVSVHSKRSREAISAWEEENGLYSFEGFV